MQTPEDRLIQFAKSRLSGKSEQFCYEEAACSLLRDQLKKRKITKFGAFYLEKYDRCDDEMRLIWSSRDRSRQITATQFFNTQTWECTTLEVYFRLYSEEDGKWGPSQEVSPPT